MRKFVAALLVAHLVFLADVTLIVHSNAVVPAAARINLSVFRTIGWYLRVGGREMTINIIGNLVVFAPIGLLWPVLRQGRTTLVRVALLAAAISLAIEVSQYCSGYRFADVDDVLLNTVGGVLGYLAYLALNAGRRVLSGELPEASSRLTTLVGPKFFRWRNGKRQDVSRPAARR